MRPSSNGAGNTLWGYCRDRGIDASGVHALEELLEKTARDGTVLILSGVSSRVRTTMNKTGFTERIGIDHLYENIDASLTGARKVLARNDE